VIFCEWVKYFDRRMSGRKVLLILDNCSAHTSVENLSSLVELRNTTVLYLPPNMTSKIQPCDAGIIRNFKAYYRQRFNTLLIDRIENGCSNPGPINVLQAICMAVDAWTHNVQPQTIKNCFLHCKIRDIGAPEEQSPTATQEDSVIDELSKQLRQLGYSDPMTIDQLLDFPEEQDVAVSPTDNEIVAYVTNIANDYEDADDEEEMISTPPTISVRDAMVMVSDMERLLLRYPVEYAASSNALQTLRKQFNAIAQKCIRQSNILDYFPVRD
jgi:hypothetical protein